MVADHNFVSRSRLGRRRTGGALRPRSVCVVVRDVERQSNADRGRWLDDSTRQDGMAVDCERSVELKLYVKLPFNELPRNRCSRGSPCPAASHVARAVPLDKPTAHAVNVQSRLLRCRAAMRIGTEKATVNEWLNRVERTEKLSWNSTLRTALLRTVTTKGGTAHAQPQARRYGAKRCARLVLHRRRCVRSGDRPLGAISQRNSLLTLQVT